ncbi:GCR1-dependent translation factor 1 [Friedmanniomyces endolithicus]|uniref:GCR1-dependent translation factor 1 n=1 Tax=Friedmanniomyces endolithicus TaxID=329885 RepID=A0AAN6FEV2_9PEZI|nr:GCR1-dependent translation factor 1 [Friedmanniomyces endolithicus]KAK0925369.1 GCR1-dependent translation factor 1 [Friedmanniomyces endolithicus]KAK0993635.1 GCR1-dependent translation factor 1 [Friedmanniomyces endolithicus]KAK1000859.1 GCR1-dependent translation factor 1 [Friedmanniomyces endolithicus]KAK1049214.1 GCR1-dependent translation factor 1 [Friedmanniomyces endolithicus]
MRLRKPSPLLLLLLATVTLADLESPRTGRLHKRDEGSLSQNAIFELNTVKEVPVGRAKGQTRVVPVEDVAESAQATASTRPYVGTEDAPVDGLDGKPHAGPFVDRTPEESQTLKGSAMAIATAKAVPTSLEKFAQGTASEDGWKLADIPEKNDGVMNDENRAAPRKGTTGTGGGISEKEKARKAKAPTENRPQEPKEAPPLPLSEQERVANEQGKGAQDKVKQTSTKKDAEKDSKAPEAPKKKGGEYGVGGYGMEKPTNLPEKPHNIPHPDPKGPNAPDSGKPNNENGPPITSSGKESWLQNTMPYTEGQKRPAAPASGNPSSALPAASDMEWHEWFHSFVLSLTMILFSEIGDKTFLIAALMAMRHPRLLVFSAAFSALIAMTVLSAVLGHAVPSLLPKRFTTFAAAALFLVFGVRMLREGLAMSGSEGVGEEMKEVEAELEEKEHELARHASQRESDAVSPYALESGRGRASSTTTNNKMHSSLEPSRSPSSKPRDRLAGLTNLLGLVLSPAWVQTFIMTFLGEWGDRSQIATIAMAAGQDYWWVTLGAITGHACCTGIAVLGGRALAGKVSLRVVTIGGAVAFLVFGVIYIYECLTEA